MTGAYNIGFNGVMSNPELKGRFIESAVGAHFLMDPKLTVYYWRENNKEVDFVVQTKEKLIAIEVKSGRRRTDGIGLIAFQRNFVPTNTLVVGTGGIPFKNTTTTIYLIWWILRAYARVVWST